MASFTRVRVSSPTSSGRLIARDTVAGWTPASAATSSRVTRSVDIPAPSYEHRPPWCKRLQSAGRPLGRPPDDRRAHREDHPGAHDHRDVGGAAAVHGGGSDRLVGGRRPHRPHCRRRPDSRGQHGHRLRPAARPGHHTRRARPGRGRQQHGVRRRCVRCRRARRRDRHRRLRRCGHRHCRARGARRSCSRRTASTRSPRTTGSARSPRSVRTSTASSGSSWARCSYPTDASSRSTPTAGCSRSPQCIGAKHSSLSRQLEWDRLALSRPAPARLHGAHRERPRDRHGDVRLRLPPRTVDVRPRPLRRARPDVGRR